MKKRSDLALESPVATAEAELPPGSQLARVDAWAERAAGEWRELCGVEGAVMSLEELRSPRALMTYALKLGRDDKSWAPAPRSLPGHLAAHVERALYRKRLIVSWGSRSKWRKPN